MTDGPVFHLSACLQSIQIGELFPSRLSYPSDTLFMIVVNYAPFVQAALVTDSQIVEFLMR